MGVYYVQVSEGKKEIYTLDAKGITRSLPPKTQPQPTVEHYCLFFSALTPFFVRPRSSSILLSTTSRHRHHK